METKVLQKVYEDEDRFKSYYVVWKLEKNKEKKMNMSEFKSYYVVWKRY